MEAYLICPACGVASFPCRAGRRPVPDHPSWCRRSRECGTCGYQEHTIELPELDVDLLEDRARRGDKLTARLKTLVEEIVLP
jgi:hypothetical protein